jgi:hypothetical protein
MKAKVIINIASSNYAVFGETHRMNYLFLLGKVVVSEMGQKEEMTVRYREGMMLIQNFPCQDDSKVELKP